MRIIGSIFWLFLICDINATDSVISCDVQINDDPFDSGFQTERTQTVSCVFGESIEIKVPSTLSNSINENVTVLSLRNNEKIHYLPLNASTSFPNLHTIDANGCSIKSVSKFNFYGLTELVQINLERNQIEAIDADSFDNSVSLAYIELDENRLTGLPSKVFEKLANLSIVRVKNNQLESLDADLFKNNKEITLLHFTDNKLKTLPSGIFNGLTLVRQIWLNGNEIEDLPPHTFDDCNSLIDLDLSRNKIKIINTNWLSKIHSLREVSFSRNPLEFIDLAIFDNNADLVMFFFNGVATRDIRNIEKVDQMSNIKGIGFHDTCVDGQFHEGNLKRLKRLVKKQCVV